MEGFTLGAVVTGIATNILAHYPDSVVCKGVKSFINYLKQDDKLINHHLQKALKFCLLSALQNIALDCQNQLIGKFEPNNMLMVMGEYPPEPSYPPGREQDIKLLNERLIRLARELGQIKKSKDIEPLIDSIEEISLLLTPEGELAQEHIQKIKDNLIAEALTRYGDLPECYKAKVMEVLFKQVCEQFAAQIKYQSEVRKIFQTQLLAQVHANSAEQKQKNQSIDNSMSILLSEMGNIRNTMEQILSSSEAIQPKNMELEKCAEGTLVLRISIDNLPPEKLTNIVQYLQQV